ncbi:MAG: glutathione S-transferase family protein [Pseudomonadota bacterium]
MLLVYAIPQSLYCAKLRILLRHKGLEWNEVPPPGGYGSAEYKKIVPSGNLPALVDGDLMLADSEAIAEYLEERFPFPRMLPNDPIQRAKVRELSRFHDTRLEPAVRALFPYLPGRETPPDGFLVRQAGEITARLNQLDMLRQSAPGLPIPTLADCGFAITMAWLGELVPLMRLEVDFWDNTAYQRDLLHSKAVTDELRTYVPKLRAFLDGRMK